MLSLNSENSHDISEYFYDLLSLGNDDERELNDFSYIYLDKNKFFNYTEKMLNRSTFLHNRFKDRLEIYSRDPNTAYSIDDIEKTLFHLGMQPKEMANRGTSEQSLSFKKEAVKKMLSQLHAAEGYYSLKELVDAGELPASSLDGIKKGYYFGKGQSDIIDMLQAYPELKAANRLCSFSKKVRKSLQVAPNMEKETEFGDPKFQFDDCDKKINGHDLFRAYYKFSLSTTYRPYTVKDNIQGWDKRFTKCICAPDGYYLVYIDLNQIDVRVAQNLYLREDEGEEKDPSMLNSNDDAYESVARIAAAKLGRPFSKSEFAKQRDVWKTNILALIYESSVKSLVSDVSDIDVLNQIKSFLDSCDKLSVIKKIRDLYIANEMFMTSKGYFGSIRCIDYDPKTNMTAQVVNSPIQTTSAEIIREVVYAILDKFKKLGYDSDACRLYLPRHDEMIFLMRDDTIKDSWVFDDYSVTMIDDWSPITYKCKLGRYYGEEDPALMAAFRKSCEANKGKYEEHVPSTHRIEEFYPFDVPDVVIRNTYSYKEFVAELLKHMHSLKELEVCKNFFENYENLSDREVEEVVSVINKNTGDKYSYVTPKYINETNVTIHIDLRKGSMKVIDAPKGVEDLALELDSECLFLYGVNEVVPESTAIPIVAKSGNVEEVLDLISDCLNKIRDKDGNIKVGRSFRINRDLILNKLGA